MKIMNLYKHTDGYEVPGSPRAIRRGPGDYVVLPRLERSTERSVSNRLKYVRHLTGVIDGICGKPGLPEVRKYRGNGGIIVFSQQVRGKKDSSVIAVDRSLLSGNYDSTELKNLREASKNMDALCEGLSKIMSDPQFLIACWVRIRSNKGSLTPALTETTLDGISLEWFKKTANSIRNGGYDFSAARRKMIPKKDGKLRPLTIPDPRDRIVQEAIRYLLEIVFEPTFYDNSHGFRPKRGCHTALNQIRMTFGYVHWFIEGDITKQFDRVNHHKLIPKIQERVKDQSFIDLIWKALRAGYGTNTKDVQGQTIGTPQGGIMSPLLSNIYMNTFDEAVEALRKDFDRGTRRKANPKYTRALRTRDPNLHQIQSTLDVDPDYKRLRYVRYADDFLVGVIGSKEDCLQLRDKLAEVLREKLDLELNLQKTKISHSRDDGASFLGYFIHSTPIEKQPLEYVQNKGKRRLVRKTPRLIFDAPTDKIVQKLISAKYARKGGEPTRRGALIHLTPYDIVQHYTQVERGLLQYYSMANNYGRLAARIHYILKYSCALTLATKLRLGTLHKTFKRFGYKLTVKSDNGTKVITYPTPSYKRPRRMGGMTFQAHHIPTNAADSLIWRISRGRGDLLGPCIACGATDNIEVHHVRHLRKKKSADWMTKIMQQMNRKQVPLCQSCHIKVHKGTYDGKSLRKVGEGENQPPKTEATPAL